MHSTERIFKFILKNLFLIKDMIIKFAQFVSFIIQYGPCKINLKCTYHLHEVVRPPKKHVIQSTTMFLRVSQISEPETVTEAPTASPFFLE